MMLPAILLHLLQAAPTSSMASLRMIAAILLVVLLCGLIYVLRNIRSLRVEVAGNERVGKRGRDRTLIFVAFAVTFVLVCLLLFLVARA
ncbi:MAG TPA: hypothetical protein VG095_09720 [Chthoniobacterales bacterium]|nr:hypothetical protein [Chthoniobacterales bacterium]